MSEGVLETSEILCKLARNNCSLLIFFLLECASVNVLNLDYGPWNRLTIYCHNTSKCSSTILKTSDLAGTQYVMTS
jgi:hypothetical protein